MKHSLQERNRLTRVALGHPALTARERLLLVALITYMPHNPWVGWDLRISKLTEAISPTGDNRTARKNTATVLRALRAKGFITQQENERRDGSQAANTYSVEWDRLEDPDAHDSNETPPDCNHTPPDFNRKSPDVSVTSTDFSQTSGDFNQKGPFSTYSVPSTSSEASENQPQDPADTEKLSGSLAPSVAGAPSVGVLEGRGVASSTLGDVGLSDVVYEVWDPAWWVEADTLVFRCDWDGTPESENLRTLYSDFYEVNGRLARQTTEKIAEAHPQDLEEAIRLLTAVHF